MNPESGRGNEDEQRSTESRIQSGLEAIRHEAEWTSMTHLKSQVLLQARYEKKAHTYQLVSKHFRNIPHKELLKIGKKIHVYYYSTNIHR
jgi:hypothetical protein